VERAVVGAARSRVYRVGWAKRHPDVGEEPWLAGVPGYDPFGTPTRTEARMMRRAARRRDEYRRRKPIRALLRYLTRRPPGWWDGPLREDDER